MPSVMNRSAVYLFGIFVLGTVAMNLINRVASPDMKMVLFPLLMASFGLPMGTFMLVRRRYLVQEAVTAYERSPKILQAISGWQQRLHRFKTYESFAMFNTVLGAVFFLVFGLIGFGVFAYRLFHRL